MNSNRMFYRKLFRPFTGLPGLVLLLTACVVSITLYLRSADRKLPIPPGAHMSRRAVRERCLQCCLRFGNSAQLYTEPRFTNQRLKDQKGSLYSRQIWTTYSIVDGKTYFMEWNDRTGNLICMMPLYMNLRDAPPIVTSPDAAARIGLNHLQEMEMLPVGAKLQLVDTPIPLPALYTWYTHWRIYPPAANTPYEILLYLDAHNGALITLVNRKEERAYGEQGEEDLKKMSLSLD